jgi:hypothetical protein
MQRYDTRFRHGFPYCSLDEMKERFNWTAPTTSLTKPQALLSHNRHV